MTMNRRDFMRQYVLNRATGSRESLCVRTEVSDAAEAWDEIEKMTKPTPRQEAMRRSFFGDPPKPHDEIFPMEEHE